MVVFFVYLSYFILVVVFYFVFLIVVIVFLLYKVYFLDNEFLIKVFYLEKEFFLICEEIFFVGMSYGVIMVLLLILKFIVVKFYRNE